jgi:DNA-binding transcriptional LysR family regulator
MDRLRIMESFVTVMRSGNFSGAARRLGLPRSAVSKHVSLLEEHLGARLFNRTTRVMTPTEVGLEYFEVAARMMDELQERENEIRKSQEEASGLLKILVPSSFGQIYFPDAILAFCGQNPHVRVALTLSDAAPQPQELYEGGIDVAIRLSDIQSSSVIGRRIGVLRWVLCAAPRYLDNSPAIAAPADLAHHNCLVHTRHSPDNIWRFRAGREYQVKVSGFLSSNNAFVLKQATVAGKGLCILPEYVCHQEIAEGLLVTVLDDLTVVPERPVYVLYADRRYLPRRVSVFVSFISKWLNGPGLYGERQT